MASCSRLAIRTRADFYSTHPPTYWESHMLARQVHVNHEPIAGAVRVDGIYVSLAVWMKFNCAKRNRQRTDGPYVNL